VLCSEGLRQPSPATDAFAGNRMDEFEAAANGTCALGLALPRDGTVTASRGYPW
jgi:hypothetical protein